MAKPNCSVNDCVRHAKHRGMCPAHYASWRRAAVEVFGHCEVDGCFNAMLSKGLCEMHYARLRNSGSVRGSKREKAESGAHKRWIEGLLHEPSGSQCVRWPFRATAGLGYAVTDVGGVKTYVHRLVCEAVQGPQPHPDYEVLHSCGPGWVLPCVAPWHLRWGSRSENMLDKAIHAAQANRKN